MMGVGMGADSLTEVRITSKRKYMAADWVSLDRSTASTARTHGESPKLVHIRDGRKLNWINLVYHRQLGLLA